MISPEAEYSRLFDLWRRQRQHIDSWRIYFMEEIDAAGDFYMQNLLMDVPPGSEWMRRDLVPEFYISLETTLPQLILQRWSNPRPFSLEAPELLGTSVQRRVETFLRRAMMDVNRLPWRAVPAIRRGMYEGTIAFKNTWRLEFGDAMMPVFSDPKVNAYGEEIPGSLEGHIVRTKRLFDDPWTQYLDLHNVWFSAEEDWNGHPLLVIEKVWMNVNRLKEMNRAFRAETGEPLYTDSFLKNLTATASYRPTSASAGLSTGSARIHGAWEDEDSTSITSGVQPHMMRGPDDIPLMQCFGYVPVSDDGGKNYDDSQWRMQLFTPDGIMGRDEICPTPDTRPPHRLARLMRVGDEPYGRSPARWAMGEIEAMSQLRNLRLAEIVLGIMSPYIANRAADFDQGDFVKYPNSVWYYDNPELAPQNVLQRLDRNPVMPEVWQENADLYDRIKRVFASNENSMGTSYGARTSASEAMLIDQRSGARIDLQSILLCAQHDLEIARDYYQLYRTFLEGRRPVQLDEEQNAIDWIDAEALDFEPRIMINMEGIGSFNAFQLDALTRSLGIVFQIPEWVQQLDSREVLEEIFYRAGSLRSHRVLKPVEVVQREMEMAQQNAMAMAAFEAAAKRGGPEGGSETPRVGKQTPPPDSGGAQ